jgi:hypothetical protein
MTISISQNRTKVIMCSVYKCEENGSSNFNSLRLPPNPLSSCNRTSLRVCYVYNGHHLFFSRNSTTTPFVMVTVSTVYNRIIINCLLLQYITVHLYLHQNRKTTTSSRIEPLTIFVTFIYITHYPAQS